MTEPTTLRMIPIETTQAVATLALSTSFASIVERWIPNSSVLTALSLSALLSNTGFAPTVHPAYDFCSKMLLPASLAFVLLSSHQDESEIRNLAQTALHRLSIPFVLASIGSVIGCSLAFLVSLSLKNHLLGPHEASFAMSCLAASFIGGSVNHFATARIISHESAIGRKVGSALVGPMAAADLVVMAVYFGVLAILLQSERLARLFGVDKDFERGLGETKRLDEARPPKRQIMTASALLIAPILALVSFSNRVESHVARIVPGTACGVIALAVPKIAKVGRRTFRKHWHIVEQSAHLLGTLSFLLFFASIGVSADLSTALVSGPACLCLSSLALFLHFLFVLPASRIAKIFVPEITHEDVLVASNAAIGGSATAASFCTNLKYSEKTSMSIAATFWGIVGYAFGTTIGISLFRVFQRMI